MKGQVLELQELTRILEVAAQIAKLPAKKSVSDLAEQIFKRLVDQGIDNFHRQEAQTIVLRAFEDLQFDPLAAPYLQYCRERLETSENKTSENSPEKAGPAKKALPVVTGRNEYLPWGKERIVSALQREGNIPPEIAAQVAQAVEEQIHRAQIRYISTAQIRELVNSELFLRGHSAYLHRQSILGIPKFNLKSMLYPEYRQGAACDVESLFTQIARAILRQYSTEEVFAPDVVDAHISGRFHIEDISFPVKVFSLLLYPRTSSSFGEAGGTWDRVISLAAELERILPFVGDAVYIHEIDRCLPEARPEHIRAFLTAITRDLQRVSPCGFLLAESRFVDCLRSLYLQADVSMRKGLPHLDIPVRDADFAEAGLNSIKSNCALALQVKKVTFRLSPNAFGNWPDPAQVRWVLDDISMNLVHAACKAGRGQIGKFWDEIKDTFGLVVKAHLDKRRFLLSLAEGPLSAFFRSPWQEIYLLEKAGSFLEIVGLPESVFYLTGKDMQCEEGWDVAVQTLSHLKKMAEKVSEKHGIRICLIDHIRSDKAEKRFLKLDRDRFPELKEIFPESIYTKGPRFEIGACPDLEERILKEGELHRYLPSAVTLMPDMSADRFVELLRFAREKTSAAAIRIC